MISGRGNKGERSGFGDKGIEPLWLWVDLNRAEFGGSNLRGIQSTPAITILLFHGVFYVCERDHLLFTESAVAFLYIHTLELM